MTLSHYVRQQQIYISPSDAPLAMLLSGLGNQDLEAWPSISYQGNRNNFLLRAFTKTKRTTCYSECIVMLFLKISLLKQFRANFYMCCLVTYIVTWMPLLLLLTSFYNLP
jgi:hypothetical protein